MSRVVYYAGQTQNQTSENPEHPEHPEHPNIKSSEHREHPKIRSSEHPEHPRVKKHPEHPRIKSSEHPEHTKVKSSEHPEHTKVSSPKNLIEPGNPKHRSVVSSTEYRKGKIMSEQTSNPTEEPKSGVTLETAMRIVPNFDGSNSEEAYRFIRACDFAMRIIDSGQRDTLVQGLLTKLSGRALRFVRYKDIISYQEFRKNIVEISDTRELLPQLQMKLLTCKMNAGEKVQEYYEKMEQLLHDLIDATLEEGDYENGKDIDRLLHNQSPKDLQRNNSHSHQRATQEQKNRVITGEITAERTIQVRGALNVAEQIISPGNAEYLRGIKRSSRPVNKQKAVDREDDNRKPEYGKRGGGERKQRTFSPANPEHCTKPAATLHFLAKLVNNSTSLKIIQCVQEEKRGIGEREYNLLIKRYQFTTSTHHRIGYFKSSTRVKIDVEFQVVHDNFPTREVGILGAPFFRDNSININFRTSSLSIENPEYSENSENPENLENPKPPESTGFSTTLIVQPRSETLIHIFTGKKNGTPLIIHAQNIGEDGIMLGNTINTVENGQILVTVVNKSSDLVEFTSPQLESVQYDIFEETNVHFCTRSEDFFRREDRMAEISQIIQTNHLNYEERVSLLRVCRKYQDLFHLEGEPLPSTTAIQHEIKVIVEQMGKLEKDKIVQPSESPWNAPLVVVPKKPYADGKPQSRVCVDFRRLNQLTIGDAFPIPRIDEILDQLGRSRYSPRWTLPAGIIKLSGAPSTFQRLMNAALTSLNGIKAFVYLDHIIIYAVDLKEHESRLEEVFQRLQKFNLRLQPSKCQFLRREVVYLGHLITDSGVKPDLAKISCVRDHPVPRNPTEIKQFLGLSGYYRRLIENYSQRAKPITILLKKGQPFEWTA
ncbi:hypothetical protein QTP88_001909 [Uroleucon formosanum]